MATSVKNRLAQLIPQASYPGVYDALRAHLHLFLEGELRDLFLRDFASSPGSDLQTLRLEGQPFLNVKATMEAFLLRRPEGVALALLVAPEAKELGVYFPAMRPRDILDRARPPFPDVTGLRSDNFRWLYVFASSDQLTAANGPWQAFYEGLQSRCPQLPEDRNAEALKKMVPGDWKGGLYFYGTPLHFPVPEELLPAAVRSAWNFFSDLPLAAAVDRAATLPVLRLRLPLLARTDPFGSGTGISELRLEALFEASLLAPDPVQSGLKPSLLPRHDNRSFGLSGELTFGRNGHRSAAIGIEGTWPIDGDTIRLRGRCRVEDLAAYLPEINGRTVQPTSLEALTEFEISRERRTLRSLGFTLQSGDTWTLVPDLLTLTQFHVDVRVQDPSGLRYTSGSFRATATLGASAFPLEASAGLPNGSIRLGLPAPRAAAGLAVNDFVRIFRSEGIGLAEEYRIRALEGSYEPATGYLGFRLEVARTETPWSAGGYRFRLLKAALAVSRIRQVRFRLEALAEYVLQTGNRWILSGKADYNAGWSFAGSIRSDAPVSLGDLGAEFGFSLPEALRKKPVPLQALTFAFGTNGDRAFGADCAFDILGAPIALRLAVQKTGTATTLAGYFRTQVGTIQADAETLYQSKVDGAYEQRFRLAINVSGHSIRMEEQRSSGGEGRKLEERVFSGSATGLRLRLLALLDQWFPAYRSVLPESLLPAVTLSDVFIRYDGPAGQWTFFLLGTIGTRPVRFFLQRSGAEGGTTLFGFNSDFTDFRQLPLVGEQMSSVSLSGVGFIYASASGDYHLPGFVLPHPGVDPVLQPEEQARPLEEGISLTAALLSGEDAPLSLLLPLQAKNSRRLPAALTAPAGLEPAAKWFPVKKKLGPVTVSRVGFAFKEGRLSLLLSGNLTLGGLSLGVEGLELSFLPFELARGGAIQPSFNLLGLGLAFEKTPLLISGSFLQNKPAPNEKISFAGLTELRTGKLAITGVGAYARLQNNSDSLFVYGMYRGPIGGPAFFFVTAIAVGFGYNRKLRLPELKEVAEFPLVKLAMGTASDGGGSALERASAVLAMLSGGDNPWLPASPGDYWLAVGIRFSTFRIVDSFVLLTAQFGNEVEFAILGLSILRWPAQGTPIAYIELAVLARFGPGRDAIEVRGMLTPNSYLFNKNCKLTGGFAFYAWVAGAHEGDFVITLGGYHPRFLVPAHYPRVDRLALNWRYSDALSLHGELYFALTPKAIMAGGRWEIEYRLSFLTARLTLWADMLIMWAPFSYEITAGVLVSIDANIKVLFVRVHFRIQMGCTLYIAGPPFGGEVHVDWSIFSFTIPFGDRRGPDRRKLSWKGEGERSFVDSFVPKEKVLDGRIVQGAVSGGAAGGAQGMLQAGEEVLTVDPYRLVIRLDSFFPLSDLELPKPLLQAGADDELLMEVAGSGQPKPLGQRNQAFGITPMGIDDLNSALHVDIAGPPGFDRNNIGLMGTAKGFNSALWAPSEKDEQAVLRDVLAGVQLHAREGAPQRSEELALNDEFYNNLGLAPRAGLQAPLGAGDLFGAGRARLERGLAGAAGTLTALRQAGFTHLQGDAITLDDLDIEDPLFWVSIGETTPKKQTN